MVMAVVCAAFPAPSVSQAATEDQLMAAYVFNFAKFVEWPAELFPASNSAMNFCALGRSAAADEMDSAVRGQSVNGHPIKVRRLGSAEEIADCHLVFLASSAGKQQQRLFQAAKGRPVLLIGESPGFARAGGTIGFITEKGKVLFEINLNMAEEAHLKISSKLLSLARIVSSAERAGN